MKLRKLLMSVVVAGALSATGASATLITLNPSAPNPGCVDLTAGPCGPVGAPGAFQTDNAHIAFTGLVNVDTGAGVAGAVSTFSEQGNFYLLDFTNGGSPTTSDVGRAGGGSYDIYGIFSGNGVGQWLSPFNFVTTAISSLTVSLYASPSSGSAPTFGNPVVTPGSQDFLLGTASIVANTTNIGQASIGGNNVGSQSLDALLSFTPAGGSTGPLTGATGFFQAPIPFVINIGSHAGGNSLATTWSPNGTGGAIIQTLNNRGGGDISFITQPTRVPEPGPLALIGLGLAVMGFLGYRSRSQS